jgi:hypothetical protein
MVVGCGMGAAPSRSALAAEIEPAREIAGTKHAASQEGDRFTWSKAACRSWASWLSGSIARQSAFQATT